MFHIEPLAGEPVNGRGAVGLLREAFLDRGEPLLDRAPAGRDEVDEQREVVDAGVPLREQVPLDALESPDDLVHQAADLGEVATDRRHLCTEAVLEGIAKP